MLLMIEKPRLGPFERAWRRAHRAAAVTLSTLDAILMWPFRVGENRRIMATLAAMSDRDLRDIGLNRQDLRDALALPPAGDAGGFLADRCRARHR